MLLIHLFSAEELAVDRIYVPLKMKFPPVSGDVSMPATLISLILSNLIFRTRVFNNAKCELQSDHQCRFTYTPELKSCLAQA